MPSAIPVFAAVVRMLPLPAPVWPTADAPLAGPRLVSFCLSWAKTAAQSWTVSRLATANLANWFIRFIAVTHLAWSESESHSTFVAL